MHLLLAPIVAAGQFTSVESFLIVPLWDMVVFTTAFALAVYFGKKPEYHKRLVLIATCALTAAAFGRFPPFLLNPNYFYAEWIC
jgi:hypothetical protein